MTQGLHVIVGLGATAFSCARYLTQRNIPIAVTDTRFNPPQLIQFTETFPHVQVSLGKLNETLLSQASTVVMSPGVSVQEPAIANLIKRGVPVIGDIELFAQAVNAPVIAITGTNAKSTVTTLVGEMTKSAGLAAQIGGNLGIPALDLLEAPHTNVFVLELSSFQLETTFSLKPRVATILNITPDHMDRYATLDAYRVAKQRIYTNCEVVVCNRDDTATYYAGNSAREFRFTLQQPQQNEFGLIEKEGSPYLAYEDQLLMPVDDLPILGKHYQANALASLAIGYGFGLPFEPMLKTLTAFKGLSHRCQLVREREGVAWYNDSKGTNVGATLAAINGLGAVVKGKLILIAGGVGKNADFAPLLPSVAQYVRTAILIGEASHLLAKELNNQVQVQFAHSMEEAVALANQFSLPGDCVLLSPACASFDMFKNFEHRGEVFTQAVKELN